MEEEITQAQENIEKEINDLKKQVQDLTFIINFFVKPSKYLFQRNVEIGQNKTLVVDTGAKISLFGSAPIGQQTHTTTGHISGASGTNVGDGTLIYGSVGSTGYTVADIVTILKNIGLIAN